MGTDHGEAMALAQGRTPHRHVSANRDEEIS
jgi:hypothetical protein